jgi:hypothetical protein
VGRRLPIALATLVVLVATVSLVATRRGASDAASTRAWSATHHADLAATLAAADAVPRDPRTAPLVTTRRACAALATAGVRMRADVPSPDGQLTRAWSTVADDVGTVATFCLDAAGRGDRAMLDEVPNYLALTGMHVEELRARLAAGATPF